MIVDIIQGSAEWHEIRLGKVTASRIDNPQVNTDGVLREWHLNNWSDDAFREHIPAVRKTIAALEAALVQPAAQEGWRVPDGWKLVPIKPTEEMYRAAYKEQDDSAIHNYGAAPTFSDYWMAALEAAPAAQPAAQEGRESLDAPFVYSSVTPKFKKDGNDEIDHLQCWIHTTIIGQDQGELYRRAKAIVAFINDRLPAAPSKGVE